MINNFPEYFLTIVRERSISKAAEKLFVSQPYLSQYVTKLEKSMETKLLDRTKSPIGVTQAGMIYYRYLESSRQLHQKLMSDLSDLNNQRSSQLHIGFSPWRGSSFIPQMLPLFLSANPNTKVVLHEYPVNELYPRVENNTIDFAVRNINLDTPQNFTFEILCYEDILLAAHKDHPLTPRLSEVMREGVMKPMYLLEKERFILLHSSMIIGRCINNYFDRIKFMPFQSIRTTNNATAMNLVAKKLGFGFIASAGMPDPKLYPDLVFFNLRSPDLRLPLAVIYKKDSFLSAPARNFIDITKAYYSNRTSD